MMQQKFYDPIQDIPLDSMRAWKLNKELVKLSKWLWLEFEDDFSLLDAKEGLGQIDDDPIDNLPF